jgi:hypothetical protein
MPHRVDIPGNLRRIARYLRAVEAVVPGSHNRKNLSICANWLEQVATYEHRQEREMSRVAEVLTKLETALAAQKSRADRLQSQLDQQSANVLDAADLAALDAAQGVIDANGGTDTTAGGTGGDTTTGAAGGDTANALPAA